MVEGEWYERALGDAGKNTGAASYLETTSTESHHTRFEEAAYCPYGSRECKSNELHIINKRFLGRAQGINVLVAVAENAVIIRISIKTTNVGDIRCRQERIGAVYSHLSPLYCIPSGGKGDTPSLQIRIDPSSQGKSRLCWPSSSQVPCLFGLEQPRDGVS
jgi:hypothetical protein